MSYWVSIGDCVIDSLGSRNGVGVDVDTMAIGEDPVVIEAGRALIDIDFAQDAGILDQVFELFLTRHVAPSVPIVVYE